MLGQSYVHRNPLKDLMVHPAEPDASASHVLVPDSGQAGSELAIVVNVCDRYSNAIRASALVVAQLSVLVGGPVPASLFPHPGTDRDQTVIKFVWTATVSGEYVASIRLNGKHVHDSPHQIRIGAATPSPMHFVASGSGLRMGVAGRESTVLVRALDAFGNIAPLWGLDMRDLQLVISSVDAPDAGVEIESHAQQDDGAMRVSWTWTQSGFFRLAIAMDGVHLASSPFDLEVFCGQVVTSTAQVALLESDATMPWKATALGDKIPDIQCGQILRVSVKMRDEYENVCPADAQKALVYVTSMHDQQLLVRAAESASSQYDILLTRAGSYQLSVTVDSQHAADSPASLMLVAGPPVSAHMQSISNNMPAWRAAEPCPARFFVADKYGNLATGAGKDLKVIVIDSLGRRSEHNAHQEQDPGSYSLRWTPGAAGIYTLQVPAVRSHFDVLIASGTSHDAEEVREATFEPEELVEATAPVAEQSSARGAGLSGTRNSQLAEFIVVLRNADQQIVCPLEFEVDVSMHVENCDGCDMTPHVFRQHCEYRVFFTPEFSVHQGTWRPGVEAVAVGIHVKLGQEHIAGSPFASSVLPAMTPLVAEARFDSSLESILVLFDVATDRGLQTSVNVVCGQYFPEDVRLLGARCQAAWIDARTLVLHLGHDASVTDESVLTLHNSRVRSACGTSSPSFGKVLVQAPRDALAPLKISLRGPALIGKCDSIRLLADSLAMRTTLTYEWSVTAVKAVDGLVVGIITSYVASLPRESSGIELQENLLGPGILNISVVATDRIGRRSRAHKVVEVVEFATPSVYLDAPDEMEVVASEGISIKAHVSTPSCAGARYGLEFLWSLSNLRTGSVTQFEEQTGPQVMVAGNMLQEDAEYTLRLCLHRPGLAVHTRGESIAVRLVSRGAQKYVVIWGGSRIVSAEHPIVLEAAVRDSRSQGSRMQEPVSWSCEPFPCFPGAEQLMAQGSTSLMIPGKLLLPGAYRLSAQLPYQPASRRTQRDTVVLWVLAAETSATSITGPELEHLGGVAHLVAEAQVDSRAPASWAWNCVSTPALCVLDSTQGVALKTMRIPQDLLFPKLAYRLRLEVGKPVIGLAEMKLMAPSKPAGGRLEIVPRAGHAAETVFSFLAVGWRDDAENLPLTFCLALQRDGVEDSVENDAAVPAPLGCSKNALRSARLASLEASDTLAHTGVIQVVLSTVNAAGHVGEARGLVQLLPTVGPRQASRHLWEDLDAAQDAKDAGRLVASVYSLVHLLLSAPHRQGAEGQGELQLACPKHVSECSDGRMRALLLQHLEFAVTNGLFSSDVGEQQAHEAIMAHHAHIMHPLSLLASALELLVPDVWNDEIVNASAHICTRMISTQRSRREAGGMPAPAAASLTRVLSNLLAALALPSTTQEAQVTGLRSKVISAATELAHAVAANAPRDSQKVFRSENLDILVARTSDGAVDVGMPGSRGLGVSFPANAFWPSLSGQALGYQVVIVQWHHRVRDIKTHTLSSNINTVQVVAEMADGSLQRMRKAVLPIHVVLTRVGVPDDKIDRCYYRSEGDEELSTKGTMVHAVTDTHVVCETMHLTEFFAVSEPSLSDWRVHASPSLVALHPWKQQSGSCALAVGLCVAVIVVWSLGLAVGGLSDKRSMQELVRQVSVKEQSEIDGQGITEGKNTERVRDYILLKAALRMRVAVRLRPLTASLVQVLKVDHLLAGIVWTPIFCAFNRCRRISCLALVVIGHLTVSLVLLSQGAAPMSAYVSVGILSAFLVFPSGMLLAVIFRTVESWSTYKMRQRRRMQRVQESVAVKEAMDLVPREQAAAGAGSKAQPRQGNKVSPKPSPPPPISGAPSFTRRSAGRSPASPDAGNARARDVNPRQLRRGDAVGSVASAKPARTPVKWSLDVKLRSSTREVEGCVFVPVRMQKAMQSAAPHLSPQMPTRLSVPTAGLDAGVARPPAPRGGPARPRALPAGSRNRPASSPLIAPGTGSAERSLPGVNEYLPRRLFGMKGGGDKAAPPAPSTSRRDKSGRRKARRDPGLTLQMDRLLPIAEIDENGPWSPTSARPAQQLVPQTGDSRAPRTGSLPPAHSSSSASSMRSGPRDKWIEPTLAPVVYLAIVAWVCLCLYLIVLHGLALSDASNRFTWAWVMAIFVSLTHEMLVQQVTALALKLLVNRCSIARKPVGIAASAPQARRTQEPTRGIVPYRAQAPGAAVRRHLP
jgi:hypothetical protein